MKQKPLLIAILALATYCFGQITPNINSGNPNFPFPQFKGYLGGAVTLADKNPVGMPHAELEQRTRDAYVTLCNNMTYNVTQNGTDAPLTVNGVKYIMPNVKAPINHCSCVEADGYYLLAAAYMGDKATFDGYYMWMHDRQFQKTTRFVDNVMNSPNYAYSAGISGAGNFGNSTNVYGGALSANSAADGDVDLGLALLVAWKQWGDNGLICTDPELGPISYKNEAIKYIRTMADTAKYAPALPTVKYISGIIGLDGYMKGGDSWSEETTWAQTGYKGLMPERSGGETNYVDYHAPAYFHSFANALQKEGISPWAVEQYKRAEASCDWVMGQAYAQGYIPWIGKYAISGTAVTFSKFEATGEDFRYGWRTILNHLWNGAPTTTWNPVTHQYESGTNNYQKDMAIRFANFLHHPENAPYSNACFASNGGVNYGGTSNLKMSYDMNGTNAGAFTLNHIKGPGSPAAVVSGNWDLMAQMFRQCVLEWDDSQNSTQRYLTGQPKYFQEWFRLLGMLTLTGNLHDPMQMQATANLKVYKSVDKTFAFYGDTLSYTVSYRNYGKLDATGTVLRDTLPQGITYLAGSSTKAITSTSGVLTWNIGTVKGTSTGNVAVTKDSVTFKVVVGTTSPSRLTKSAVISCTNGSGWTSNEYPNRISEVMERNYVDILGYKKLDKKKTASKASPQVGDTLSYRLVIRSGVNTTLNGGRQGVFVAGAHDGIAASQNILNFKYKIYHGAHEPLINYKNYRVSYFVKESPVPTWNMSTVINEGSGGATPTLATQMLPNGASYNQRLVLSFPNVRATIAPMLAERYGMPGNIHEGVLEPHRLKLMVNTSTFSNMNLLDDWSAEAGISSADANPYFPIGSDWTDPNNPNQTVTKLHPNQCGTVTTVIKKQLVEEWDGYTWRRIYGDAPVGMLSLNSVVAKDTLLANQSFVSFASGYPQGSVSGNTISWPKISTLSLADSVVYKYTVKIENVTASDDHTVMEGIAVYPNPAEHAFTLQVSQESAYTIYDVKGLALEQGTAKGSLQIGAGLRAGLYVLKVDAEAGPQFMKIEKK